MLRYTLDGISYREAEKMKKKGFTPEQIITMLGEAEVLLSQGGYRGRGFKKTGYHRAVYYRWRKEYGGMRIEQAKRLKELEKESTRLKKLIADLSLDNAILRAVSHGGHIVVQPP
jgi:hypothetical protein